MISREIAEALERRSGEDQSIASALAKAGGLDVAACEAAGLAHDLGHPPFGHAGETELNRLLRKNGVTEGFEGNAQSFRIVCALDWHDYERGLDLSNVVLAAILKYPWTREPDPTGSDDSTQSKFGAYNSEKSQLERARRGVLPEIDDAALIADGRQPPQSLEASIMDLADDIAYSIHDLEDFCSQGFIDLSVAVDALGQYRARPDDPGNTFTQSAAKLARYPGSKYDPEEHVRAAGRVQVLLDQVNAPQWSQSARDQQLRGDLSKKVGEFFSAIQIDEGLSPIVSLESAQWHDMQVMKRVTKHFLVGTSRMAQIQRAQRQTIERLFLGLAEWLSTAAEDESLPETLIEFIGIQKMGLPVGGKLAPGHYRAIADYICTMSDSEAFLRAQWVSGTEIPGIANLGLVD